MISFIVGMKTHKHGMKMNRSNGQKCPIELVKTFDCFEVEIFDHKLLGNQLGNQLGSQLGSHKKW